MSREPLPDCQDITFSAISARVEDMATRRANCAVGDARAGKPLELHLMLTDLIHHETRSAYLAGYLQATEDGKP